MFIKCHPFQNVVNDGLATINFANLLGYAVEFIMLELGTSGGVALTKSQMSSIKVLANGKDIVDITGAKLDDMNEYRGETADASYLVIPFDESRGRCEVRAGQVIDGEKIGIVDTTRGIVSLTGEVLVAGANAPTLKAWAEVSAPQAGADPRFRDLISKVKNFTVSPAASGTFQFDVPYLRKPGAVGKRIYLFGSTVTGYEVKKNGITIMKADSVALNTYSQKREGRVPQSNVVCIDFIKDGNQSAALNAADAATMEYEMTVSGSGNVVVVVEFYDLLGNN